MSESATSGLSAEDRERIDELSRQFVERMLAGDAAGLGQLYTVDGVLMPPNHPSLSGQGDIADFLGAFPKVTRFSASNDDVDGRGDIAYVRGSYVMTMEPEGGEPIDDRGTYLEVRRRQQDGSWPIAVDMFSSDIES